MATELIYALAMLGALLALLACGLWVGLTLLTIGWGALYLGLSLPTDQIVVTTIWTSAASWTLSALPLFIWMGEILVRTKLSENLFKGLSPWLVWLPGRLMHVNTIGCGIFAAVSGSSAATAATVGRISLPQLHRLGYDSRLSIGSLAGGASLGLLIPPSLALIVYGVAATVSITDLFIAAIVPGLLVLSLFSAFIALRSLVDRRGGVDKTTLHWRDLARSLVLFAPIPLLVCAVLGTIYTGVATATEAAALGVVGALFVAAAYGQLTWAALWESLISATRTTCMIGLIIVAAAVLASACAFLGIPRALAEWVAGLQLGYYGFLLVLLVFYIVLGCFLDGFSVILLTGAVIMPLVRQQGIDLIWFGIFITLAIEMSQITPPVGFNLYVLQGLTGKNMLQIAAAAFPFFLILVLSAIILMMFPGIVHVLL